MIGTRATPRLLPAATAGAAVVALLVGAVWLGSLGSYPVRPLFDGLAPPSPYNWVNPPPDFAPENRLAENGEGDVVFKDGVSVAQTVVTADAQASMLFQGQAFAPVAGEKTIEVSITAVDPATLGSPPEGQSYDGNAYVFEAVYAKSRRPARIAGKATVLLRYPAFATAVARLDGGAWTTLAGEQIAASLQVFADVDRLGTYVAVGVPGQHQQTATGGSGIVLAIASGGAAVLAAGLGLLARRRSAVKAAAAAARKKPPGAKGRKPKRKR